MNEQIGCAARRAHPDSHCIPTASGMATRMANSNPISREIRRRLTAATKGQDHEKGYAGVFNEFGRLDQHAALDGSATADHKLDDPGGRPGQTSIFRQHQFVLCPLSWG